jgi:hypothetical protein
MAAPAPRAAPAAALPELFAQADVDRDGRLNVRQVHDVLSRGLGLLLTERERRELGYVLDRRYYGLVTLAEFGDVARDAAARFPSVDAACREAKAALRAHGALPVVGGARGATAASGAAAGVTDVPTLTRLLTRTGDRLSAAELTGALRQAGVAPGDGVIDTDALVDALAAAALAHR